jgi:predicted acetyltransferase
MQTRSLTEADFARALDIRNRSFGVLAESERPGLESLMREAIADDRLIGVYDDDLLVGRAMIWDFDQWWCGRPVRMAGVAGVVVAPDYRGRGVGGRLLDGLIERGRALGHPLSVLYPANVSVYRKRGWELAGSQYRFTIEARLLRDLRGGGVPVRPATPDDAEALFEMFRDDVRRNRHNGIKDTDLEEMREDLASPGIYAYVAERGFVQYGWDGSDLVVYLLVAADAETARALWAVVGSGSSIAKRVHAYLAPDDPVAHLVAESVEPKVRVNRWMLRCLDARAAVEQRGYPLGVEVEVPLVLSDEQVPANRFSGRLAVGGGRGSLVAGEAGAGATRLGPHGLAALYAGVPTSSLRTAGLLRGGSERDDALLDAAYVGRPAYLLDFF